MRRGRSLLLVLLFGSGCATAIPVEALRDARFTVESQESVYLLDGAGERSEPIAARRQTRDGPSQFVRSRNDTPYQGNNPELMPIQSVEVLLVRLADGAEQVVMSIPATRPGRVLLAPV